MNEIKNITDQASSELFRSYNDAIVIFYKELCPHCKNMEKALMKFGAKSPETELYCVDSEVKGDLMAELGFERVPTLIFIRNGEVANIYSGLMNPRELKALHASL
ncbi:thioredoxin family protein [Pseudodesulfovibrio thermohalotolerans]|uniref:thioredoxin family protein n=1 Tax=Pseudodesulfovibrio thermohalotolerans TaxID=2880651 RepID=UPI0024414FEE|nr:thioredoxin family protein [Pseudodesulfovibrio thermohalotolerans]WFS61193.1 thioredoxin family protein [Pseudodesulfovibrio thermohalotolerans]